MSKKQRTLFIHSTNEDYLFLFGTYVHKTILKLLLFFLLLFPVFLLGYEIKETYDLTKLSEREKITYRYDDVRLNYVEGYVILINDAKEIIYEGEFSHGACNGSGTVYQKGKIRYVGKLVDNQYEDEKGKLYDEQGKLLYEGGFVKGVYDGEGFLYYPSGYYQAQGTYKNGELNGNGIEYSEDGNIIREGEYLYGRLNGQGISYYEGNNIRRYVGEFSGNTPLGTGTLFTTSGRAWYQGQVYGYQPDYESYLGATYVTVREHFLDQIQIYTSEQDSAMVMVNQGVLFVSAQPYQEEVQEAQEEKQMEEATYTKDASKPNVDETKLFIQGVVLISDAIPEGDQVLYEEQAVDGAFQYDIKTEQIQVEDLYAMVYFHLRDQVSLLDAFFQIKHTKGEVITLTYEIPTLYRDRYTLTYNGVIERWTMFDAEGRWSYRIYWTDEEDTP